MAEPLVTAARISTHCVEIAHQCHAAAEAGRERLRADSAYLAGVLPGDDAGDVARQRTGALGRAVEEVSTSALAITVLGRSTW